MKVTATIAADDGEDWEARGAVKRGRAASDVLAPGGLLTLTWAKSATPSTAGLPDWAATPRRGVITCWDITYTRHETFIELGFKNNGGIELLDERYVGSKRHPTRRQRAIIRLRCWYTRQRVILRRRFARGA